MTRQKLGQHFLNDQKVLNSIVDQLPPPGEQMILEVGPGKGVMTERMLSKGYSVLAVEWDSQLAESLTSKLSDNPKLLVVQADIRTFDVVSYLESIIGPSPQFSIAANLPYYLSSFFLRQVFEWRVLPKNMVLLLQKEVAERLCAKPGQTNRSILSIMAQSYSNPRIVLSVPRSAFYPPPEVDSAVIVFDQITDQFFSAIDRKKFFQLVKAGFSGKRKTLLNSLSGGLRLDKSRVESILNSAGIDSQLRAQDISNDQWLFIYKAWQKG